MTLIVYFLDFVIVLVIGYAVVTAAMALIGWIDGLRVDAALKKLHEQKARK